MSSTSMDFERWNQQYPPARDGIEQIISDLKQAGPTSTEIAAELGSAKFTKTSESFSGVIDGAVTMFESILEAAGAVDNGYKLMDQAVN